MTENTDIKKIASEYKTIVSFKDETYFLIVPELGIAEESPNLEKGYKTVENKKSEYLTRMFDIKAENQITPPGNPGSFFSIQNTLKNHVSRYLILFGLIVFGSLIAGGLGGALVGKSISYSVTKLEQKVDNALVQDDKKREKRLVRLKAKLDYFKPYIKEIKNAFDEVSKE
jgi:hypothetical protein